MMSVSKPNIILATLFLLLFLFFKLSYCIGNSSIITACPEIEKLSLLTFKQSLHDPSNLLSSWNGEVNCCKWEGVFCSNLTGHVHALHLQGLMSGKINPCLLNLKHLKYLDLSQNDFNETIPSFIGSLTGLEYLDLSHAGFYGKIPHAIGNLSNLHTLSLEEYSLEVDKLEWLSGLSKLMHLNMSNVDLSKVANWAQVINKLPSLLELHLSSCSLFDDFTAHPLNDVNITFNNLGILDLSYNRNYQSSSVINIPRWIFQLSNLIYLDLSYNSLEGPIPNTANTTKLQHIDLSWNYLNSSIPDWLYFCNHLEFVDLSADNLQNEISNSIANLTSLNTLGLIGNNLSGKIPRELTNLCRLQNLYLSYNKLQGEISDSFGNMSACFLGSFQLLNLGSNQLSGHLTHQFGEFQRLGSLYLLFNSISGVIPNNIGNLSSLEYLYLATNKLTGNLPESMGQLLNLNQLDVSNNKLTGNLPESMGQILNLEQLSIDDNTLEGVVTETHFAHLSKLTYLLASNNHLTLEVSSNWIPPFKLTELWMGSWNLGSGSRIPTWLETQKNNISGLDLSSTGISGNVPTWFWNILYLNLSHNQLHGEIPNINGVSVYLGSNKFSGLLPRVGINVRELDVSNNSFSGDMSHFLCDTNEIRDQLEILHLGGNHLSGEFPDCWMNWPSLRALNLGNNNLSGSIPNSIGYLAHLRSLSLYGNKLSGHIPFSMHNCTNLIKLDLTDNNLDENIPSWMGTSLSQLMILILRSNVLSGEFTSSICQLSYLQILDISDNKISGIIPTCVNNFTAMATKRNLIEYEYGYLKLSGRRAIMESASITTKGRELYYDTILSLVTNIDLSNNNLSGDIPKEITSLVELRSLNLSRNYLTGLIPYSIGNMTQLESLDFSLNSLSGEMPSSFSIMSSLNYLNVSYNNLTGRIPESTQILGFNESSFITNNLCGPPLTISCGGEGSSSTGLTQKEDEDDKAEIEWIYVIVSLGYAVGLSATLTAWFLKKSWSEACYELLESPWDSVYVYFYIRWTRLTRA